MLRRFDTASWLSGALRLPVSREIPQGLYLARDIRRFLPRLEMRTVFDVGANEGQTAVQYAVAFRSAKIECFEPVGATYRRLAARLASNSRVTCHQVALGSSIGTVMMSMDEGQSDRFRITESGTEAVPATTISQFSNDHGIGHINLVKIDTEGYDLKVVQGAEDMLKDQKVDLIEVEAGMNPENELHVYFEQFTEYLHGLDYRIFGIYEQMHEWKTQAPNLRRSNIVFVSRNVIDRNSHV